jgi:uncharacterized membrane protein YhaH (DUF805 family)
MKNYLKTYFFDILFKKFFDCTGKADRKEFWLFTLNLLVCISAIYAVIYFDFPKISPILFEKSLNIYPSYDTIIFLQIIFSLIILFPVLFLLPFINLLARRLHDIGLSAKYLFLAIFFIRYARFLPFIIGIIGCIPGKKEGNKYDEQNIKNNTIKKIFMNGTILLLILLFFYSFPYALTKGMRQKKASCNQLINDIAKAQLKYFKENNDFLYVYETDRSDILNIDLQNDDGVDKFSCTVNTDDIDNKSVEIKVWAKIDDKRKEKLKGTYYLGYISATQYQDGKLSRMLLNLDKKTAE